MSNLSYQAVIKSPHLDRYYGIDHSRRVYLSDMPKDARSRFRSTQLSRHAKGFAPITHIYNKHYVGYVLAKVYLFFPDQFRSKVEDNIVPYNSLEVLVNVEPNVVVPYGFGANSATYCVFNPEKLGADFTSGATSDMRKDWRWGHNEVFCIKTDKNGVIRHVWCPNGSISELMYLTEEAITFLKSENDEIRRFEIGLSSGLYATPYSSY